MVANCIIDIEPTSPLVNLLLRLESRRCFIRYKTNCTSFAEQLVAVLENVRCAARLLYVAIVPIEDVLPLVLDRVFRVMRGRNGLWMAIECCITAEGTLLNLVIHIDLHTAMVVIMS